MGSCFPCEKCHRCPYKDSYTGRLSEICGDLCGQHGKLHYCIAHEFLPCSVERPGRKKCGMFWSLASAIANIRYWNPDEGKEYSGTVRGREGEILYSVSFRGEKKVYQHYDFRDGAFFCFEPRKEASI